MRNEKVNWVGEGAHHGLREKKKFVFWNKNPPLLVTYIYFKLSFKEKFKYEIHSEI